MWRADIGFKELLRVREWLREIVIVLWKICSQDCGVYQIPEILIRKDSQISEVLIERGERRRFAMSVPIPLRRDFNAPQLRGLAKKAKYGPHNLSASRTCGDLRGATRTEAAKIGGVGLQIVRDWVLRFNADGADGLMNGKSPGNPRAQRYSAPDDRADDRERPDPGGSWRGRWRLIDLAQWIWEEFRITIASRRSAGSCGL